MAREGFQPLQRIQRRQGTPRTARPSDHRADRDRSDLDGAPSYLDHSWTDDDSPGDDHHHAAPTGTSPDTPLHTPSDQPGNDPTANATSAHDGGRAVGAVNDPDLPLLGRAEVIALVPESGPRRALGQNFVIDPNMIRSIVRKAAVAPGEGVLEIGPGIGSLTLGLLAAGARVTCVEKDPVLADRLQTLLADRVPDHRVEIIEGDALAVDLGSICEKASLDVLVSNLPYNIATPLILRVLRTVPHIDRMLVMVQREVAERLAAEPGTAAYGSPSVRLCLDATARVVGVVPPEVFHPRPRVSSALLEVRRRPVGVTRPVDDELFEETVRRAFGQRRKTLRRSLGLSADVLRAVGIDADARPEELGREAWIRLCNHLAVPG
jgi:16S rRNA (adenine1518-N6/adenine1519-N6)-dimethyltransferase